MTKDSKTLGAVVPSAIPSGLERDPIALRLSKKGQPVTRAAWLTLDRGSSDESELDPEVTAMLDRMFPVDDSPNQDDPNRPETEADSVIAMDRRRFRARPMSPASTGQTPPSSQSPSNTPGTTASPSDGKDPSPK